MNTFFRKWKRIGVLFFVGFLLYSCQQKPLKKKEQPVEKDRMEWFRDARFGMFIHWGLYAIPAGEWKGKEVSGIGEWIQNFAQIPNGEYEKLAQQFNPRQFDSRQWVRLAKQTGMKYLVITAKHHDGFSLFPSEVTDFDIEATPFGRDPLRELAQACQEEGIKLGFYYSHRQDWHEVDASYKPKEWEGHYDVPLKDIKPNFERYLQGKALPQVKELLTKYGPISLIWYDTPFDLTAEQSKDFVKVVRDIQPQCIINGRIGHDLGDYGPLGDNEMPIGSVTQDLEMVATMNHTWGYKKNDHDWKCADDILLSLVECASRGVNYMLNVGPDAKGAIPQPSVEILERVGSWMSKNSEAIYGTKGSPFPVDPVWGRITCKSNKLFLHITKWPEDRPIQLIGLRTEVKEVRFLDLKKKLDFAQKEGTLNIQIPQNQRKGFLKVIELTLAGEVAVDSSLQPRSDGSVLLPACRGRITPGQGGCLNFGNGRQTENWSPQTGTLTWRFQITQPGTFGVRVYTSRHWRKKFPADCRVSLRSTSQQLNNVTLRKDFQVPNVREHSYPEVMSKVGEFSFDKAGEYEISMNIENLGSFTRTNYVGEDLGDMSLKNIRLMQLELVPEK